MPVFQMEYIFCSAVMTRWSGVLNSPDRISKTGSHHFVHFYFRTLFLSACNHIIIPTTALPNAFREASVFLVSYVAAHRGAAHGRSVAEEVFVKCFDSLA